MKNVGSKGFTLYIIMFVILLILILMSPTYGTIEITVDDNETVNFTVIEDNSENGVDMLLYYFPLYNLEDDNNNRYEFITYDSLGFSKSELELLSAIVWAESRGECDLGQELVVVTVLNRLYNRQTWWGYDIESLVVNSSQFNGSSIDMFGFYTDLNYNNVLNAIQKYNNREYNESWYKILYFHNPSQLNSDSYMAKNGLYKIIDVGGHRFMGELK